MSGQLEQSRCLGQEAAVPRKSVKPNNESGVFPRQGERCFLPVADSPDAVVVLSADDEPPAESRTGRAKLDPENGRIPPVSAGSVSSAATDGKRRRNEGRGRKLPVEVRPTQQPLGLEVDNTGSSLAGEQEKRNGGAG